jgi:hypothetical protein
MPDLTDQTPSSETAPGQTSGEGTAPASATVESTPPSVSPAVPEDYKAKFSASTAENQRLRSALDQKQREMLQMQQIMSTQVQPQQPLAPPPDDQIYNQFTDSVLDRNVAGLKQHDRHVVDQAKREIVGEMQNQTAYQARINNSLAVVAPVFAQGDTPLAQATIANYARMMNDPVYSQTIEPAEVQVPGSTVRINPHIMREAVKEAKLQILEKSSSANLTARRTDTDSPESAGGASNADTKPKFDSRNHLTEDERDYCNSTGTKYETYWKYMKDDIREERLATGKPTKPRKR